MKEQKKPVKKWHFICTHKYTHTQSRKGRPSPRFSPFAYFPISHNTNQTAKLTRPPNKSAILRVYRHAPWQHQPNEAFGMPAPLRKQAHEPRFLPRQKRLLHRQPGSSNWGRHPHAHRTAFNTTNTSASLGSQKGSPQPNTPTGFIPCHQNLQSPKIIKHFKKWAFDVKYVICYKIESIKLYRN